MPNIPEEKLPEVAPVSTPESVVGAPEGSVPPVMEAPFAPETVPEKAPEAYRELLSKVTPTKQATPADDDHEDTVILDAKHIGAMTDEESKVQKLLDLAGTKGVVHAVKVARSLKDYYALDRMHDELAGKFYDGLLEKGLIEKE